MQIRELGQADLKELLILYAHLHEIDDPTPPLAIVESVWSEIISSPRFRYFGVIIDGHLVASCNLTIIPNLTRACRPYGLIENVVTHRAHRNRGLGKAILARAVGVAWEQDCYKVMLMTGRKDEATLRFYQSAGFDPTGKQAFVAKPSA
ncbi:GNAT family N-acetyltransferase [Achromobacter insolitus]|uniref:GNAT family N-acetyltransferase n=1 Tax=Alcaligenaceae TaxID=506 RepID=UPI0009B860B7|nr:MULTISPECIES: GNAT family N-acetyltransferase [Alcaligenaceae]MDH3062676.1 GNAT family N-acetyltransferase [Achromobacter insolitus]